MIFAQASAVADWAIPLTQTGVAGAVLLWFMLRVEARLTDIEKTNDREARAILLLVVSLNSANETAKQSARDLLTEIADSRDKAKS